jgi:hypothetical protein
MRKEELSYNSFVQLLFYAHGHPKEICQQRLARARRASRERLLLYSIAQARI